MKRVLVVDDEPFFLRAVQEGLAAYSKLQVHTATNGEEAIEVLRRLGAVDLILTDLNMPRMDGFALLAELSRRARWIPTIVISAYASEEARQRLASMQGLMWLDKPLDIDVLSDRILSLLAEGDRGYLPEMTLASFLQLMQMERKSCHLRVTLGARSGELFMEDGKLVRAVTGRLAGDDAAFELIGWGTVGIDIEGQSRGAERNVTHDLGFLIMESARRRDEADGAPPGDPEVELVLDASGAPVTSSRGDDEEPSTRPRSKISPDRPRDAPAQTGQTAAPNKERHVAIEKHLQQLRDIKGYRASAILSNTGETLVVDSAESDLDLALVGATFNDILRAAHEAAVGIDLDAAKEVVIKTKKGVVVMQCSGVEAKAHVHFIGVLTADGNQALMKMRVDQFLPKVVAELG